MRCAHYAKEYISEYLKLVESFCSSNNITAKSLIIMFKDCLVSKDILYHNSGSTGIVILILFYLI